VCVFVCVCACEGFGAMAMATVSVVSVAKVPRYAAACGAVVAAGGSTRGRHGPAGGWMGSSETVGSFLGSPSARRHAQLGPTTRGRRRRKTGTGTTRTAAEPPWLERPVPVDLPSALVGDVLVLAFLASAYAYFARRRAKGELHGATSEAVPGLILLGILGGLTFKFASALEADLVFAAGLAAYYGFVLATAHAQRDARRKARTQQHHPSDDQQEEPIKDMNEGGEQG